MLYQYVGFLKSEDKNIRSGKDFEEMFLPKNNDSTDQSAILRYLEKGVFLTGVMSYIYDDENIGIGNLNYYTDGQFIWPIYYTYYIKKYKNFLIEKELLSYARLNNYTINSVSEKELKLIEKDFDSEWSGQWKKHKG